MADETTHSEDADKRAKEMREHHQEAQKRDPDERDPDERQPAAGQDRTEEGVLGGLPGSAGNRPTG